MDIIFAFEANVARSSRAGGTRKAAEGTCEAGGDITNEFESLWGHICGNLK